MKYVSTAILVLSNFLSVFLYFTIITDVEAINTNENRKFDRNIGENGCNTSSNVLVAYKFVLHTYWTRQIFPKHFPDWKPQAQWSKTFG